MATWAEYQQTMQSPPSLHAAAKANDVAALEALLDAGLDLDAKDARGHAPLMLAAYNGNAEAFELLLAKGANPNTTDAAGNSVLMGAAFKGHLGMVKRLLAAGADPRATNGAGLDAAAFAEQFGRTEVAAYLQGLPKPS